MPETFVVKAPEHEKRVNTVRIQTLEQLAWAVLGAVSLVFIWGTLALTYI